jgi:hypothetical protein
MPTDLLKEIIVLKGERAELRVALHDLIVSAEVYMKHHEDSFYSTSVVKPTGLWPAIDKAKRALPDAD